MRNRRSAAMPVLSAAVLTAGLLLADPTAAAAAAAPAKAGDFNGDGYVDLAAGEPLATVGTADYAGRVRVVYGSSTGLKSAPSQTISEDSAGMPGAAEYNDSFGSNVVSADFNADGCADLAILADNEFVTGAGSGSVTLVLGAKTGLSSTAFAIEVPAGEGLYGPAHAGDLNHDGIPDLIMHTASAPYVLSGSTSLTTNHPLQRLTPPDTDQPDVQDALVGDVNGDGRPDLTVPYISAFTGWKTAFAVYFGSASGLQPPQRGLGGDDVQNGYAAMGMGDVNGDGKADLIIGNDGLTDTTRPGGQIRVWLGAATPFAVQDTISQDTGSVPGGGEDGDGFGGTISVGDLDGDGRADVLTGGVGEDIGTVTDTGSVWIVYGGDTTLGSDHDQMFSQASTGVPGASTAYGAFGESVALLDLNKDGRLDPVIAVRHDQGVVLLTGAAGGATVTGAREIKPIGDSGEYILPTVG
ncbi:FG-GAP-like repeat-containing protein [Actinomadura sp. DC4]|uniref:FG-GAP-like repeat-containing protein n=1 Tax=Actinomadura sp. DC4 TaxID=3055069 RepID=UPI0025B1AB65|nr:FG-GAP-like repeat-containing protein [Actinomadura sp. DC4]MDN3353784.1 FG-GAP-like repeat-containing protein [Actinomadura sp. DC4]